MYSGIDNTSGRKIKKKKVKKHRSSYTSSRGGLGASNPSSDHTRKFFCAHAEQHPHTTSDQDNNQDSDARNQEEGRADVLLLASWAAPINGLLRAIASRTDSGLAAAGETLGIPRGRLEIALSVPGATVGGFSTR